MSEREHVRRVGHDVPTGGGTVYLAYLPPEFPNGGTVYVDPPKSGNPYARIDEDTELLRPVVVVELPPPSVRRLTPR